MTLIWPCADTIFS